MTGGREAERRPGRAPLRQRSRKRWGIAAGVAACWVVAEVMTGSVVSATVLLVIVAGLVAVSVGGLRALGITRDHPWIRQLSSRPWRDGQDVLNVAMRHLSDVFVVTPSGSLLAPSVVELQLNPDDLGSLCERMELGVISASLTEVYEEQVATYGARLAGPGRAGWAAAPTCARPRTPMPISLAPRRNWPTPGRSAAPGTSPTRG